MYCLVEFWIDNVFLLNTFLIYDLNAYPCPRKHVQSVGELIQEVVVIPEIKNQHSNEAMKRKQ